MTSKIWLSLSQGLRGSDPGVVWRVEMEPVALETRPGITKASKFITRKVEN